MITVKLPTAGILAAANVYRPAALVVVDATAETAVAGWVMLVEDVAVQPCASVTVTVYVPIDKEEMELEVFAPDQE